ncbi:P-loop NTPase fold protein [Actinomadura montaniterrae]|uniref:P-loop NTPase fold protein n=1 Tax=Actinomadura montaniterrae TaxID=1803903 RepID=UPI00178C6A48|nr:P-loop NTPase fold protein [Actinomadura montaniterrae]
MSRRPWLIEDGAIDRREHDRFGHLSVAQQLSSTIQGSTQPCAVGLLGPFGSGKSSVVKLLSRELSVNKKWAVLHVSAEHHSGVARARGLMYALLDEALRKKQIDAEVHASERACLEGSRQRTHSRPSPAAAQPGRPSLRRRLEILLAGALWVLGWVLALWLVGAGVVAIGHLIGVGRGVSILKWFADPGVGFLRSTLISAAVVGAVVTAAKEGILQVLKGYEITVTSPRPDTTDELQQVFSRLVESVPRRLVIAIDDIDRLASADVLEALTTVRSLLLTGTHHKHPPVFVISCDEDIVREAIVGIRPGGLAHGPIDHERSASDTQAAARAERKATEEAVQEYLNKLFTVRFTLPTHNDTDLRDHAEHLLTQPESHPIVRELGGLGVVRDVLDALIHRQVREPRHAIRLLNSFISNYAVARHREQAAGNVAPRIAPGEVTGYPVALARLIVLRHDFRSLYDRIVAEHKLLFLLDDALLGSPETLQDPLLDSFERVKDTNRLNTQREPGLVYLRATAARARTERPSDIAALLTLGSKPANRLLGSDTATAIQDELAQRDSDAFAARLENEAERERVLHAAYHTINTARVGQDLDNSLAAAVQALGRVPALADHATRGDACARILFDLTDRIAHRRIEASIPLLAHDLVTILDFFPIAHVPQLYAALKVPPRDPADSVSWVEALLQLPAGKHRDALLPGLDDYFSDVANQGTPGDLETWITVWNDSSADMRAAWPAHGYQALLCMAARHENDQAMRIIYDIVALEGVGSHQWCRPVILGILDGLSSSESVGSVSIELLSGVKMPADGWGPASDAVGAGNEKSTLAAELVDAVADFLRVDSDAESSARTVDLLRSWIPVLGEELCPSGRRAGAVIADVTSETADTCEEVSRAVVQLIGEFSDTDARTCALALAERLPAHRSPASPIGENLSAALMAYVRRTDAVTGESEDVTAAERCLAALMTSIEEDSDAGRFGRGRLAAILSTRRGQDAAAGISARLTAAIPPVASDYLKELLASLHLLFNHEEARAAHLPTVLSKLQNILGQNQPQVPVEFAAHYAAESSVSPQWIAWIAQHWGNVSIFGRQRVLAAADRTEISNTVSLLDLLVQHLLASEDMSEWEHAPKLWASITSEQRADLLASANGRCPELSVCASSVDRETLTSALCKAADSLDAVLKLIEDNPESSDVIVEYLDQQMENAEWRPERVGEVVAGCPSPEKLWDLALRAATRDMTHAVKAAVVIESLIARHPDTVPESLPGRLGPVLIDADTTTAAALGKALQSTPDLAKKLQQQLRGHGRTSDQRSRTKAYKKAAGI